MAKNTETATDVQELVATTTTDIEVSLTKKEVRYLSSLLRLDRREQVFNLDDDCYADWAKEAIENIDSILKKIGY